MLRTVLLFCLLLPLMKAFAQENIHFTNPLVAQIVAGQYNPAQFPANQEALSAVLHDLQAEINADSLKAAIIRIGTFKNRNTGSDTLSVSEGIGAARRWAYGVFEEYAARSGNRLQVSYLQFDQDICTMSTHRNICAVLPGTDTTNHEVIIVEAHLDSRCEDVCGLSCQADGIEDNASGSALVLELARVMSQMAFKRTILFVLTIGEEQGLYGANALAQYCKDQQIPVRAVFNNDVIGGVICGKTSSSPSCPGENDIDSLQVRLFSSGGFNAPCKQLSRFVKLEYQENLLPIVPVPMTVSIMTNEDRAGRGGDHIPFRQKGFTSMRFTSANEHGDASNDPGYTDRQHTSNDILGLDTNGDQEIDSFFIDFSYLARNTVINGNAAAMAAMGPKTPDFEATGFNGPVLNVLITDQTQYAYYRVGVRSTTNDWDTVYTISGTTGVLNLPVANIYYVSVASVDEEGIESLFSREIAISQSQLGIDEHPLTRGIELLQNRPNPFDEATTISVLVKGLPFNGKAEIVIYDAQGKLVERLPITLNNQINEVVYHHGYGRTGVYSYALEMDGRQIAHKQMVFAN